MRARILDQLGVVHVVHTQPSKISRGFTVCEDLFTYGESHISLTMGGMIVPHVERTNLPPTCLTCIVQACHG